MKIILLLKNLFADESFTSKFDPLEYSKNILANHAEILRVISKSVSELNQIGSSILITELMTSI